MLLSFYFVKAQHRNELWTKINVTKSIGKRLDAGIDFQHRRQNGFENDYNMLRYGMTSSIRLWTYYKLKKNWSLILSPIAYFDNQVIKVGPEKKQSTDELKTMLGITKNYSFANLINKNRFLYEISSIATKHAERAIRYRYRLQNAFSLQVINFKNTTSLTYTTVNEILFKTLKNNTNFDQNRLYNGIQWKGCQRNVNVGFQYTFQKEGNTYVNKNQLLVSLNLNL